MRRRLPHGLHLRIPLKFVLSVDDNALTFGQSRSDDGLIAGARTGFDLANLNRVIIHHVGLDF
jgi:hypothetical protein